METNAIIENAIKELKVEKKSVVINGLELTINPKLDIYQISNLINDIISLITDQKTGVHAFHLADFYKKVAIVVHHSDFEVPTFINEKGDTTADIGKLYEFITYTDFYDQFLSHLTSKVYVDELNNMVGTAISCNQSGIDALINKLIDFVDTFGKQFEGLDTNQLTEMISAIQVKETKSNVVELASQGALS